MCYINSKCGNPLCLPWSFIEDPFFYRFIQSCKYPAAAAASSSLSVPFSDPIASFFSSLDFPSLEAILNPFSKLDLASLFNPESTSSASASSSSFASSSASSSSSCSSASLSLLLLPLLLLLPHQIHLQIRVQIPLLVRPFTFSLFLTIPASKTALRASSTPPMCIIPCINGTISRSRCKTSPTRVFSTNL